MLGECGVENLFQPGKVTEFTRHFFMFAPKPFSLTYNFMHRAKISYL